MDAGERERIDGRQQHHRHGLQGYTWKSDTGSSGRRKERNGKRLQYDHRQGQAGAGSGRAGSRKRKAERGRAKQERSGKRNLQSMTGGSRWTAARGDTRQAGANCTGATGNQRARGAPGRATTAAGQGDILTTSPPNRKATRNPSRPTPEICATRARVYGGV